jgi:hypothetical protein
MEGLVLYESEESLSKTHFLYFLFTLYIPDTLFVLQELPFVFLELVPPERLHECFLD